MLKTDLDIRPVYHKSDNGIKSHLNLAILAYWVVSVTKYRLKLKKHENVRWDEIMRIASTQVVVTAKVETVDGQVISIRQSTEAESKLSAIYDLLYINPKPLGKRKSMLHPNIPRYFRWMVCVLPRMPVSTAIPLSRISTFSYLASTITFPFNVITPQCLGICSKAQ